MEWDPPGEEGNNRTELRRLEGENTKQRRGLIGGDRLATRSGTMAALSFTNTISGID